MRLLRQTALAALCLTFVVVVVGAYVRLLRDTGEAPNMGRIHR